MKNHRYSTVDELRQSTRFRKEPDTAFAAVYQAPGDEILAEVHDESLGGLGLLLNDVQDFPVGRHANIVFASSLMDGVVRHIQPREDGRYLVGFACERLDVSEK